MRKDEFLTQLLACRSMMAAVIHRIVRTPDIVDDLLQDCLVIALKGRLEFREEAAVKTWAYIIAKNRALMWRRTEILKGTSTPRTCGLETFNTNSDIRFHAARNFRPDKMYEDAEVLNRFMVMTEGLSPRMRTVVRLRTLADLTYLEIAQELRTSEGTVKSQMFRARKKLARERHAFA